LLALLVFLVVIQLSPDGLLILRYLVSLLPQTLDLLLDILLALDGCFVLVLLVEHVQFAFHHIRLHVVLEGLVVDEDPVLQAGELVDERDEVPVHELLAVVKLDDVV